MFILRYHALLLSILLLLIPQSVTLAQSPTESTPPGRFVEVKTYDGEGFGAVFGVTMALQGDTLVVGSLGYGSTQQQDTPDESKGRVYIYERTNGVWSDTPVKTYTGEKKWDQLGYAVALDGDTLVIGTGNLFSFDDAKIYIYQRTNGIWSDTPEQVYTYTPRFYTANIALDGNTLAVGVSSTSTVYMYERTNGVWSEQPVKTYTDEQQNGSFGFGIALEGNTLAIGAAAHYVDNEELLENVGKAYVYERANGVWQDDPVQTYLGVEAYDYFGFGVDLDNGTLAISALAFNYDSDTPDTEVGKLYVYERNNGIWTDTPVQVFEGEQPSDLFAYPIEIDENWMAAALYADVPQYLEYERVYLYQKLNGQWLPTPLKIFESDNLGDGLGYDVEIDGTTIAIGAATYSIGEDSAAGRVYIYEYEPVSNPIVDMNADGSVTPADAIYVVNRVGGNDLTADVNGDNMVDLTDVSIITQFIGQTVASE